MVQVPAAGELKHTLGVIHRGEGSRDKHGQPVYLDRLVADDLLAAIDQLSGREVEYAQQLYKLATYRVRLRYNPLIYSGAFLRVMATGQLFAVGWAGNLQGLGIWHDVLVSETTADEIGLNLLTAGALLLEDGLRALLLENGEPLLLESAGADDGQA